jgi:hypothetical protein
VPNRLSWNIAVAVDQLALLLSAQYLFPEVFIGADARLFMAPLLALPLWLFDQLLRLHDDRHLGAPAFVVDAHQTKSRPK